MLKYNSYMGIQKTKQTRGDSAATEAEKKWVTLKRTRGYSAASEEQNYIKKKTALHTNISCI